MSNCTPTTRQVRRQYTREEPPSVGTVSEKTAEFNRWLAAEKAKWQAEVVREVIDFLDAQEGDGGHARFAARLVQWWQDSRTDRIEKGADRG